MITGIGSSCRPRSTLAPMSVRCPIPCRCYTCSAGGSSGALALPSRAGAGAARRRPSRSVAPCPPGFGESRRATRRAGWAARAPTAHCTARAGWTRSRAVTT
eukprot:3466848-Prymnesium_polylepis.1